MKIIVLAAACLLCLGGTSFAASGSDQSMGKAHQQTVSGCLSKTGNAYVITGGGPGPMQYRIDGGNTAALQGKLGHTVAVTGPVWDSSARSRMMQPYHAGSTTGVGYKLITADQVRDVGANCSFTGSTMPPSSR
jgi:hypothetical protein